MVKPYWITYAWADDKDKQVSYFFQQLKQKGIPFSADRYSLGLGKSVWEQIGRAISDEELSGGWAIYATESSFESLPCREEFNIALNRALETRGENYPVIGVFPGDFDKAILPVSLRTRLCVSLQNENWPELMLAALEGRSHQINEEVLGPVAGIRHPDGAGVIWEFRSRLGAIGPIAFGVLNGNVNNVGIDANEPFWIDRPNNPFPDMIRAEGMTISPIVIGTTPFKAIDKAITSTQSLYVARLKPNETLLVATKKDGSWTSIGEFR